VRGPRRRATETSAGARFVSVSILFRWPVGGEKRGGGEAEAAGPAGLVFATRPREAHGG
jgi:hypothetical protein